MILRQEKATYSFLKKANHVQQIGSWGDCHHPTKSSHQQLERMRWEVK
jgi:hypothetical protein